MKPSPRLLLGTLIGLGVLAMSYGVVFSFYVSGLFGDGRKATAPLWEIALRRTVLLSPFLAAFVLLAIVAWKAEWGSGILPWGAGAIGVLLLARWDAGILAPFDPFVLGLALLLAWRLSTHSDDGGGEEDDS